MVMPTQNIYIQYFSNICDGYQVKTFFHCQTNKSRMVLESVIFHKVPEIYHDFNDDDNTLRPYLQIFQNKKIRYNSLKDIKKYVFSLTFRKGNQGLRYY